METIFMFVNYIPDDLSKGMTKKINSEITALRRLGYNVYYTAYTENGAAIYDNNDCIIFKKDYRLNKTRLFKIFRYSMLLHVANTYLHQSKATFDYCYGRMGAMNSQYISLLEQMKQSGTKVILEAHSYFPGMKWKDLKGKYVSLCLKINHKKLAKLVDKVLTEGQVPSFWGMRHEHQRIGVETNLLPKHYYKGSTNELNLITVANEIEYHAYDRLIKSLAEYKARGGKHIIKIHLVGVLLPSTIQMIQQLGLQDSVIEYGKVYGDQLFEIYDQCNMGIGPLGQHRNNGKKDTGLKTKEYFGIGLPYFYTGEESDLPQNYPYIFEVPNDESMLDFDKIWEFYLSYKDDPSVVDKMRGLAQKIFSWDEIMKKAIKL